MPALIVIKVGNGNGRFGGFIPGGELVVCEDPCTGAWADIPAGTIVTLGAQASPGSQFVQWEGYAPPPGYVGVLVPGTEPPGFHITDLGPAIQISDANPLVGPMPPFDLLVLVRFNLLNNRLLAAENAELWGGDGCPPTTTRVYPETVVVPWPLALVAGVGFHGMRLGHDCPCGLEHFVYRVAYRFDISQIGPNQQAATFSGYRLINVNPANPQNGANMAHPGSGNIVMEWVDHDGPLGAGTADTTVYNAPALYNYGVVLTPGFYEGRGYISVVDQLNAAKAQGRSSLVLRLRLEDESPSPCLGGAAWYCVGGVQSSTLYQPYLDLAPPKPTIVPVRPVELTMSVIEPCVLLVGDKLETLPDFPDWNKGRGRGGIQTVRRGNILELRVLVTDNRVVPAVPFDASEVLLTLNAADDTIVVDEQPMERIAKGIYRYLYRTKDTDPLGLYLASVEVIP